MSLLAFYSCSKDDVVDAVDNEEVTCTITGVSASVEGQGENSLKNYFVYDTIESPHVYRNFWGPNYDDEKIVVFAKMGRKVMEDPSYFDLLEVNPDAKTASFGGNYSFQAKNNQTVILYGLYPSSIGTDEVDFDGSELYIPFPAEQKCTSDGGLENTPMMSCKQYITTDAGLPSAPEFEFKNIAAFLRFNVTGQRAKDLGKIEAIFEDASPWCYLEYPTDPVMYVDDEALADGEKLTITLDCNGREEDESGNMTYLMATPFYVSEDGYLHIKFRFLDKGGSVIKETKAVPCQVRRCQVKRLNIELN